MVTCVTHRAIRHFIPRPKRILASLIETLGCQNLIRITRRNLKGMLSRKVYFSSCEQVDLLFWRGSWSFLTVWYLFSTMSCYMSVLQTSVRAANFIYYFVPHSLNKFVQLGGKLMCLVTSCTRLWAVESLCISVLCFWCFWSRNSYKLYSHYKARVCTIQQLKAPKTWVHCSLSFIWLFARLVFLCTSNKKLGTLLTDFISILDLLKVPILPALIYHDEQLGNKLCTFITFM